MTLKKFNYLLISILICIFEIGLSGTVRGKEIVEMKHKSKHTIFLIHGIGGNKKHFGKMDKALKSVLNGKNEDVEYSIVNVEYDTGNDNKTPYDFAKDINTIIQKTTASGLFQKQDKISLIMHSQGGLVGSIWLFQSMQSTPGYATPKIITHVDSFITLATPFWGAKTAQWGSEIKSLAKRLGTDLPLPFGQKELEQMSFGSDMIYDFRQAMINPEFKPIIDYLKKNIRFLNIVGVADVLNPLGIFISGSKKYEDDGAVPLSSARFDFLYLKSLKDQYEQGDRVLLKENKSIEMSPYIVVNALHRSPVPDLKNFASIVQVTKDCINNKYCGHPSFKYIVDHLQGKKVRQRDEKLGDFKTFLIDINVQLPKNLKFKKEDVKIEFFKLDGGSLKDSNIEISHALELNSEGKRFSDDEPHHLRAYYMGSIKRFLPHRENAILLKISMEGLRSRFIEVKLKESYSTFIEVNLINKTI
ncbi:hypothetical protein MNBD_UNCLBAC01-20 [hydrothermal vent metagenome]|uniref:DUF676 domain-containing protein n=1 Tax=hydrothermal vent metagenome TaxID=652676 RepID=A0A3B1E3A1_9ZZZZ